MTSLINKILGWMALGIFILPSCVEEPDCSLQNDKTVDVRLTITLPKADTQSIITKANRTDFNTVNDLNVLVFNATGNLLKAVYFNSGNTGNPPEYSISPALPLNNSQLTSEITLNDLDPAYDKIFLVGNYGSQIPTSVTTITQLNTLTQSAPTGIPNSAMLFAEATQTSTSGFYTYMSASLKRTLAMVTVAIDGTLLTAPSGKEIRIIPKTIKLKNVPTSGIISTSVNNISNVNATNVPTGDQAIVSSWATLTSSNHITVGGHEETAIPLFQFENKQGNKPIDQSETLKSTSDKPYSSYLEVEAFYQYYDGSVINKSGTIIYRFCLGSDITQNFDVVRNTHYRVTLNLSGWGGALEDGHISSGNLVIDGHADGVSWRVDLSLRDFGFLLDEFNYDSHATYDLIESKDNGFNIRFASGYSNTNWIRFKKNKKWDYPDGTAAWDNGTIAGSANYYYKIYILPWLYRADDPTNPSLPYRETKIEIQHNSGSPIQTVTIRQWKPILIYQNATNSNNNLYMERFEEAGNSLDWGYLDKLLSTAHTSYLFKFYGTEADGWNNTLYLYNNNGSPTSPAAQLCMKKAGYDFTGVPVDNNYPPVLQSERAAYYMPSVDELGYVIGYIGDPTDPYQYHDPIKTNMDYWSSSAPDATHNSTYFWNHTTTTPVFPKTAITTITNTRNTPRNVRCVYRYSLNTNAAALP